MTQQTLTKMRLELRRGVLVVAVLTALQQEHYGYSLRKYLNNKGLDIDEGTLYPLIRRLEKDGLLVSEWRQDVGRKKRFYQINSQGQGLLVQLNAEWQHLNKVVHSLQETD